jgi:hypothetical protein
MSNFAVVMIVWVGVLGHLAAAIVSRRRLVDIPIVPLVNLVTSALVLADWAQRWYGYLFQGITWYASDQLLPLYALIVCVLSAMAMRSGSIGALQWVFLAIDGVALLGAAILIGVLRFDRMM